MFATRAAAAAALLVAVAVGPASAAPRTPTADPAGAYCSTKLEQTAAGDTRIVQTECFDTYADALAVATGGRLHVGREFRSSALTQRVLDGAASPATLLTDWVIGQDWEHNDRGGRVRTYWVSTSNAPCTGRIWEIDQLDLGWDTIISSAQGFSGCDRFEHWEDPDQQGAVRTCSTYCSSMGVLNDQTSSLRWRD
jgi:hypothetical protein